MHSITVKMWRLSFALAVVGGSGGTLASLEAAPPALATLASSEAAPPAGATPDKGRAYSPSYTDHCVDGSNAAHPTNKRLVFVALPPGPAPAAGWPVYFSFVTDSFGSKNGSYGGLPGTAGSCEPIPDPDQPVPQLYSPFEAPGRLLDPCIGVFNGSAPFSSCSGGANCNCDYDQLSGAMWSQREKGLIVQSGVAVVQLNPRGGDDWDAGPAGPDFPGWGAGPDEVVFERLFAMLKAGELGPLDRKRMIFRGWSSGAQMVSWFAQLHATGALAKLGGGAGVNMVGGVYLSGGSYTCYTQNSTGAHGVCASCNSDITCPGGEWQVNAGCSTCTVNCGAENRTGPPCCSKCCPTNYTEQYYFEHPEDFHTHPPAFLAQGETQDENADLCACKNYHETLLANGVASTLVLQPKPFEECGCLGQPEDPAAAGSPYLKWCAAGTPTTAFCHTHIMSFAGMVAPLVKWIRGIVN